MNNIGRFVESILINSLNNHHEIQSESLHLQKVHESFILNFKAFAKELPTSNEELGGIKFAKTFYKWMPIKESSNLLENYEKSKVISTSFRERGNDNYRLHNSSTALHCYNLAILFAPPTEEDLAFAYANRALVLLEMGYHDLALQDLDFAQKCKYPAQLEEKLERRRRKCTKFLKDKKQSIISGSTEFDKEFKLRRRNPKLEVAEACVEIANDENCGRKLVVNEHVPCGTFLLIEEPFAVSLEREVSFDTNHCHFCFIRIIAGIPCEYCPFSCYCSLECMRAAMQSFHQYEHRILGYLCSEGMTERDLLIIRIIFTVGPEKLWKYYKTIDPNLTFLSSPEVNPKVKGQNPTTGVYESSFFQIINLISHKPHERNENSHLNKVFNSLAFVSLMDELSPFFSFANHLWSPSSLAESEIEDFKDFVSALILRCLEVTPYNAVSFSELQHENSSLSSVSFGTGLFATISLLNHSCAPNAVHVRRGKGCETGVISLRALAPGDEVTISYGPCFAKTEKSERQEELKRKYNFLCRCFACEGNWPISSSKLLPFICPGCSESKNNKKCLSCAMCAEIEMRVKKLEAIHHILLERDTHSDYANSYVQILVDLKSSILFFDTMFPYPFQYTQIAEELLKKVFLFQFYQK